MPDDPVAYRVTPVRTSRPRGFRAVAAVLVLVLAGSIGLGVTERLSGGDPTPRPAVSRSPASSPVARASASIPPRLVVHGAPVEIAPLLVRAGGLRVLDLASGTMGPRLSADPLDQWLQRDGDGSPLVCVCRDVQWLGGREDEVTLLVGSAGQDGTIAAFDAVLTSRTLRPGTPGEPGSGTIARAALSPDGDVLLLGIAEHSSRGWSGRIALVKDGGIADEAPLPPELVAPSGEGDLAELAVAWAALDESGGSLRAIATVTGSAGGGRWRRHVVVTARDGRLTIGGGPLRDPPGAVYGCRSTGGPFLVRGVPTTICASGWPPAGTASVRTFDDAGVLADDRAITVDPELLVRGQWLHEPGGRLVHWNPAARHLAVLEPESGKVLADVAEGRPAGDVAGWNAAPAGPILTVDPTHGIVYVLAAAAGGRRGTAPMEVTAYEFDGTRRVHWEVPPAATSIALTRDGDYLLVAVEPALTEPYPSASAGVVAYDARTQEVRLAASLLGNEPIRFAPSPAGRGDPFLSP